MRVAELDLDRIPRRSKKTAAPEVPSRKAASWRRIARSLRLDGPQTIYALSENLRLSQYVVGYILDFWVKRGDVEREGRRYKLTPKGAEIGKPRARRPRKALKPKPTVWDKIGGDD